jgi:hypothetical protein
LTENVSKSFTPSESPFAVVDPTVAIDQVFDFWIKSLDMQREVAKQIVGVTIEAGEKIRSQAESFAASVPTQA